MAPFFLPKIWQAGMIPQTDKESNLNKLEQLEATICSLPEEYNTIRTTLLRLVQCGAIADARAYAWGLLDAALYLTNDKALIQPLQALRGIL